MRRFFYSILTTCAFAAVPGWAAAQATISGRVTGEGGQPLPNASVVLQGTNLGAVTRETGDYTLTVPAARTTGQTATLSARRLGYTAASVTVTLVPGENWPALGLIHYSNGKPAEVLDERTARAVRNYCAYLAK